MYLGSRPGLIGEKHQGARRHRACQAVTFDHYYTTHQVEELDHTLTFGHGERLPILGRRP
jgi:hypothetical protein